MDQNALADISVEDLLNDLLELAHPLEPLELPLLDAHGATLAEDVFLGERKMLSAGNAIRSTHIGLAASLGLNRLPARPHPRVVIISAGDDLVEPGYRLQDNEDEFESNSWMLTTAVREAGATAYRVHAIPENEVELRMVIEDQMVRADLIVLSGETHDESFDLITAVLNSLSESGVRTVVPRMSDTGRHNFGTIGPDHIPVVTLPGDPVAAYISAEIFIRPMIRTMIGASNPLRRKIKARLREAVESPAGTRSFVRAALAGKASAMEAAILANQHELFTLADAQGLIMISEEITHLAAGDSVDVMLLESNKH
jgi:molybdopterin biosynthesis enzyme